MEKKKVQSRELAVAASDESLALLRESYPVEASFNRIMLPRLAMASQDVVEGKGKSMKVIMEAGTFYTEKPTEDLNDEGKKIWAKEEIGSEIEGIIIFQRRQLKMYDEKTGKFTSSPIYDTDDEIVPLFCEKVEVGRGTPKDLKENYQYTDKNGKVKSNLQDNRVLYVLYDGDVYQMNLRGTSMYSFLSYGRKFFVPSVLTHFSSEPKENGATQWSQMSFEAVRKLNQKEVDDVLLKVQEIKNAIIAEKSYFAPQQPKSDVERVSAEEARNF